MPLEMRVMGASEVTMAPQRGNKLGTCAIEVLTLRALSGIWEPYAQQVLDKWTSYKDNEGNRLAVRPHWAKEWYPYKVDGRPWLEKLKHETYKDDIPEFKALLTRIGAMHGWTLADVKKVFSNDFLDWFYLDDVQASSVITKTTAAAGSQVATNVQKTGPIAVVEEVKEVHV